MAERAWGSAAQSSEAAADAHAGSRMAGDVDGAEGRGA